MDLPRRIVQGGGAWERQVILSARKDVPSPRARRELVRTIAAAVGAGGLMLTSPSAAQLGGMLWLKWLGAGIAAGVLSAGAASYTTRALIDRQQDPTPGIVVPVVPVVPARTAARESAALPSPAAVHSAEIAALDRTVPPALGGATAERAGALGPTPAQPLVVPAPLAVGSASYGDDEKTELAEQIQAMNGVHAALAAKDPRGALARLDAYGLRYPSGLFALEAEVLRLDALAALGDEASLQRLAQRFLAQHPDSPYARRVRSLLNDRAATTNR